MKKVVTFGEIMGRMASPANLRLRQTREFEVTYAGAEASVAASICNFGGEARYITALPKHEAGQSSLTHSVPLLPTQIPAISHRS